MRKLIYIILLLSTEISIGYSQVSTDAYSGKIRIVEFNLGQYLPLSDLSDRFGNFSSVGSSIGLLYKNNIQLELRGHILFGRNVKEDVFENLRNDQRVITGVNGAEGVIFLRMRGSRINCTLNKIIPRNSTTRSGIKLGAGAGIMWHRIHLQDDSRSVAQLVDDYQYGYDRLTTGFTMNQFIGYQVLAKNQTLNFVFGIELFQAFSKNRRSFNFSGTSEFHNSGRLDAGAGLKIGFMMTFYQFDKPEEIFY